MVLIIWERRFLYNKKEQLHKICELFFLAFKIRLYVQYEHIMDYSAAIAPTGH